MQRCEFPAPLVEATPTHCTTEAAVTLLTPILSYAIRLQNAVSDGVAFKIAYMQHFALAAAYLQPYVSSIRITLVEERCKT